MTQATAATVATPDEPIDLSQTAYRPGPTTGSLLQVGWDNTSLSVLRACPRKYYYQNIMGLRPKGQSPDLVFGIFYHKALETFDAERLRSDHKTAARIAIKTALVISKGWASDHKLKTRESLVRAVFAYTEHFRADEFKTVQLSNGKAAVELSFRFELDIQAPTGEAYLLSGHLDRLCESPLGDLWVLDRKTSGKQINQQYMGLYKPNGQMLQYTFAGQVILDRPIQGVMIDAVQLQAKGDDFARFPVPYTPDQLDEWLDNTRYYIKMAERYAEQGFWPQNVESCHHYSGCQFKQLCGSSKRMREVFIKTDYTVDRWDPLKVR